MPERPPSTEFSRRDAALRAFIAIALPEAVLDRCRRLSERLRGMRLQGRFSRRESLHLTLRFLGNIDPRRVAGIAAAMDQVAQETAVFDLNFHGLGVFPHLESPRVIWLGVDPLQELLGLYRKLGHALRPLGFAEEARSFHPHLTLARLKSRKNLSRLVDYLRSEGAQEGAGRMTVKEFHLFQSILGPEGAQYRTLSDARLRG